MADLPPPSFWDERFAGEDYLFGTAPADFLLREAGRLPPGARILSLADGEGRNSVHLAALGHHVTALEYSPVAIAKARTLAATRGVTVDHVQADIADFGWPEAALDAVVGIFLQFAPPPLRSRIHAGAARSLKPGGMVMLHGYAPRQIGYGTGGPRDVANLYTLPELTGDFPGWQILQAADYDADLAEGTRHVGRSALVDFIARKPALAPADGGR